MDNEFLLTAALEGDRLLICRDNQPTPILTQQAAPNHRPFIHPIVAPDGEGVLTEDSPPHHPWQHGLYIGLNDVNGIGFWCEGLNGQRAHLDGTFHPQPPAGVSVRGNRVSWTVYTEYRHPDDQVMIQEAQEWMFADHGHYYEMDLHWKLQAEIELVFGQYDYGGLFLRMPFRSELGGTTLGSEGFRDRHGEAGRARWVAVQMPVEGRTDDAGIVIMDHPSNLNHPVPWRIDWELGIGPSSCIAGGWTLSQGESRSFRYRLLVFTGSIQEMWIEEAWQLFARREFQ